LGHSARPYPSLVISIVKLPQICTADLPHGIGETHTINTQTEKERQRKREERTKEQKLNEFRFFLHSSVCKSEALNLERPKKGQWFLLKITKK